MRTSIVMRLALGAAVAALLVGGATVALATFGAPVPVTQTTFADDGNLVVDGGGVNHVVYAGYGSDPGIFLRTGSGSTWDSPVRISSGHDYGPWVVLDGSGKHHVVFGRDGSASERGVWYATDATGSWVLSRIATDPTNGPSMAVDGSGHLHVVYVSYGFTPGTYHLTNATGSWVRDRVAAGHIMAGAVIAISGTGVLNVAVSSYAPETKGVYVYSRSGAAAWAGTRVTTTYDSGPSLDVDGSGKLHVAFRRFASGALGVMYATNATGSWASQYVVGPVPDGTNVGTPALRLGAAGQVNVALAWWQGDGDPDSGDYLFTTPGAWSGQRVAGIAGAEDTWVYDLELYGGEARLVTTEWDPAPGTYLATTNGTTPSQQVSSSAVDLGPTLALDGAGHRHMGWHRTSGVPGEEDTVNLSTDVTGGFVPDEIAAADSDLSMVLDADGKHHVAYRSAANGIVYASDATGSWVATTVDGSAGSDPSIALDGGGDPWLAYAAGGNLAVAHRSGITWSVETAAYLGGQAPGRSSIAVDGSGRAYAAIEAGDGLLCAARPLGAWNVYRYISDAFGPAFAASGSTVRFAYSSMGADPGTYVWLIDPSTMVENDVRLTRTWAESRPSIAVDAMGHYYVAVARDYWAANPGVYLVTDRAGTPAVIQVTTQAGVWDPSVAVNADQSATIAYDDGSAGITLIAEVDLLSGKVRVSGGTAGTPGGPRLPDQLVDGSAGASGLSAGAPAGHPGARASGSTGVAGGVGR